MERKRRQKAKPDLNRSYFKGCDYEAINWKNAAIYIIPLIFEKGVEKEIRDIVRYYGKTEILRIIKRKLPFKSQELTDQISLYFNVEKKKLQVRRYYRAGDKSLAGEKQKAKNKPNLPRWMFWEFRYDEMNWEASYNTVIDRVAERGDNADYEEMIRFYGREKVIHTLRDEIVYMHEYVIEKVCAYFGFRQEELLCFWRRYTRPGPRFMPNEDAVYLPQIKFLSA
jgi:hypothetical protein